MHAAAFFSASPLPSSHQSSPLTSAAGEEEGEGTICESTTTPCVSYFLSNGETATGALLSITPPTNPTTSRLRITRSNPASVSSDVFYFKRPLSTSSSDLDLLTTNNTMQNNSNSQQQQLYPHIKKIKLTMGPTPARTQTYPGLKQQQSMMIHKVNSHQRSTLNTSSSATTPSSATNSPPMLVYDTILMNSPASASEASINSSCPTPLSVIDSPAGCFSASTGSLMMLRDDSGWTSSSATTIYSSNSASSSTVPYSSPFELPEHFISSCGLLNSSSSTSSDDECASSVSTFYESVSQLAISDNDGQLLSKDGLLHPSAMVDPLEETDEHKEGTERRARECVRSCMLTNTRLTVEYRVRLLLGWGGNGAVLGARRVMDNMPVAIKLIYKSTSASKTSKPPATTTTTTTTNFNDLPSELRILMGMKHSNVIQFLEWFEDEYAFYMVSERIVSNWTTTASCKMDNMMQDDRIGLDDDCITVRIPHYPHRARIGVRSGASDMFSYIDSNSTVPAHERQTIFAKIAKALVFLHENGVTHGDLKEENILLTDARNPKLCDFGHARKRGNSFRDVAQVGRRVAYYGTRDMTPPELLGNLKKDRGSPSLKRYSGFEADVWALGLLLYSMCTGTLSTEHRRFIASASNHKYLGVFDTEKSLVYPGAYDRIIMESGGDFECIDLMKKMLRINPGERWTMEKIINHPWIAKAK